MITSEFFQRLNGLNCTEYLLKGVANYYGRDFELMYLGAWGYDINFEKKPLEDGFISAHSSDTLQYLQLFHRIQINTHYVDDYNEFAHLVRNELSNDIPVMATVDLYWIPWTPQNYLRLHWGHEILIVGEALNGWQCYDFFNTHKNVIPFHHLEKCFHYVRTIQVQQFQQLNLNQCMQELKRSIQYNLIDTDAFKKIKYFAEWFSNPGKIQHTIFQNFSKFADFQRSAFMGMLNRISQTRSQYALMLRYMATKFDGQLQMATAAERFDQMAAAWKSVWGMLQKAYLMNERNFIITRIGDRLNEIAQIEQTTYDLLLRVIHNPTNLPSSSICFDEPIYIANQQVYISLEQFVNHKSINSTSEPVHASFQNGFIIADKVLESGFIVTDNSSYKLYISQKFDNISCSGQKIPINLEGYAISILCCSEFAHQTEKLYFNGKKRRFTIPFYVTSWTWSNPEFQQEIAWTGFEGFITESGIQTYPLTRYIFSKKYLFPKRTFIKSIELPYCPNIHIFGITMHN